MTDERFDQLLALTAEVGDPVKDYVILAEGNTSARIDDGSMPCDGAWSEEQTGLINRWVSSGMPE